MTRCAVALLLICLLGRLSVRASHRTVCVSGGVIASRKRPSRELEEVIFSQPSAARAEGKATALVCCLQTPDLAGLGKFHTIKAYQVAGLREGIILFLLPKKTSSYFYFPWKILLLGYRHMLQWKQMVN